MKKRFLIGILLVLLVFISFVVIRESSKKYNLQKYNTQNDIIKNYNFMK